MGGVVTRGAAVVEVIVAAGAALRAIIEVALLTALATGDAKGTPVALTAPRNGWTAETVVCVVVVANEGTCAKATSPTVLKTKTISSIINFIVIIIIE
jgi:hypothetical protein